MVKQVNLSREEGVLRDNNKLKMKTMPMVAMDRKKMMKEKMKKDRKMPMEVKRSSMTSTAMKYLKRKLKNTCVNSRINTVKMVKETAKAVKTRETTVMETRAKTVDKNMSDE